MEQKLLKDFELDPKNRSEEALQRWRSAVSIVKNPRRRFRHVADLAKRSAAVIKRRKIQVFFLFLLLLLLLLLLLNHRFDFSLIDKMQKKKLFCTPQLTLTYSKAHLNCTENRFFFFFSWKITRFDSLCLFC